MRGLGVLSARGRLAAIREDITRRENGGGARDRAPPRSVGPFFHCAYWSLIAPIRPSPCPFVPEFDPFVTFFSGSENVC